MLDNEDSPFWLAARREIEVSEIRRPVSSRPVGRGTVGTRAGKKLISLTFDDGPHTATTPSILRVLKQHRVPATFFLSGRWRSDTRNWSSRLQ
jgi:peptidoglycan/xylan/chitin deacetylase (PgdA/CDA1 family)